jgi:type IV pilus assembly protein PilQ
MKNVIRPLFGLLFFTCAITVHAKAYDFEFKQAELTRVISQLAKLGGRSAIFSGSVQPKMIDISLRDVAPDAALRLILESHGYVAVEKQGVYHVMTPAERGPTSTPTKIIAMSNVLAKEIEPNIKAFLGTAGAVTVNEQLNALVVSAPDDMINRLRDLVAELDQESPQVLIEAKIVESSTKFSRQLGIEWGPSINDRSGIPGVNLSAKAENDAFHAGVTTSIGARSALEARLTAGERNGDVKIVSSPKISTLNGMPANIESTTTLIIRTLATTQTGTSGGQTAGTPAIVGGIERVKAGISLRVTPYILSRLSVRLLVQLSKSDPDDSSKIDGIPGIADNTTNTSLIVHNGETASIGGLVEKSKAKNTNGIPFLSTIPVLGGLFGSQEKTENDKELMIFLTPTIFRRHQELKLPPPPATAEELGKG